MTEEVNLQRLQQTNKCFLHYKQLNTFDHPYHIHKYLDSETSTVLLVNRYIIFNKFVNIFSYIWSWFTLVPYLAKGLRPDINNGPGVTRIVPTFWPQHLLKFNLNNGPSPGHSSLVSDEVYICSSLLLMISWWVPYRPKGCRSDFNNGLGGDSNSGLVLVTRRLFESHSNNGQSQAIPMLDCNKSFLLTGL